LRDRDVILDDISVPQSSYSFTLTYPMAFIFQMVRYCELLGKWPRRKILQEKLSEQAIILVIRISFWD